MPNQEVKRKQQEQKIKNQKVKEVWSLNQALLDQQSQDLSWRINRWENLIVFSIAFSLPTNQTSFLT